MLTWLLSFKKSVVKYNGLAFGGHSEISYRQSLTTSTKQKLHDADDSAAAADDVNVLLCLRLSLA